MSNEQRKVKAMDNIPPTDPTDVNPTDPTDPTDLTTNLDRSCNPTNLTDPTDLTTNPDGSCKPTTAPDNDDRKMPARNVIQRNVANAQRVPHYGTMQHPPHPHDLMPYTPSLNATPASILNTPAAASYSNHFVSCLCV